ncbi:MAG TPA: peptidyl-prolyl cis-trans isomerase [Candidatus Krumholzibacterium sp.]|nr:peptidyl-prolyl cis-trans isomerase [Candidatus Krumholzibacterium sp.]
MKKALITIAVLAIALAAGCSKTERKDLLLAEVDYKTITVGDFEVTAETLENKYLPETNDMEGKKELLQHMINKEIMALKAEALGYEKDEEFVQFWGQFKGPFLITALWNEEIKKKVTCTEEEIDYYFEQMHYEYTLSQLIVASEQEALSLRERILAGEDFAEVTKKYSLGQGAENGGYVGSQPVGRIHWWVEEVLFSMKEGDISPPVKTDSGWALLKLHRKRKIVPDLDRDYAEKRVKGIKEYKGRNDLKAKIEEDIHLQVYTDAVTLIYDALPEDVPFEEIVNYRVTRENAPKLEIPEQYLQMIVMQHDDGVYTIADFIELYERASLVERPRKQYGRESIVQLLKKVIYDKILPVYAEDVAKVLEIPEVKKNYDNRREQFLVYKLYKEQIEDELAVTDREVREYYENNKEYLQTQEQRDYQILVTDKIETAQEIVEQARAGADFDRLVRVHSMDPTKKDNLGKTGLMPPGNYIEYDDVAFSLPAVGDISDPFQFSRGWAVVKILEIVPGRIPTLTEATGTIKKQLLESKGEALLAEKLETWSADYMIKINEKNLEKAEMSRTRL